MNSHNAKIKTSVPAMLQVNTTEGYECRHWYMILTYHTMTVTTQQDTAADQVAAKNYATPRPYRC
jgi:hypothetical protein